MMVRDVREVQGIQVREIYSRGERLKIEGVTVRWLVHKDLGGEDFRHNFALRHFTFEPGARIPLHEHEYVEGVFVISGKLVFFDAEGKEKEVGPGQLVYTYTFEPHGLYNPSTEEPATFTCTIDCPGDKACCAEPKAG